MVDLNLIYLLANQSNPMGEITINLNGEKTTIKNPCIVNLLKQLQLNESHVIIEINNQIIPKQQLSNTRLTNNDTVKIIRYIGGGKN